MNYWIAAARPKTLSAAIVPVLLASAWCYHEGSYQTGVLIAALIGALALQIGTNFVNDASDFLKGADTEERLGPPRMAASGLLTPKALFLGATTSFIVAFLAGSYLISVAGAPIFWIGLASIFFAIIYTAGPYPLAYLGLGDLFVLIFFGLVAVLGTVFAHGADISFPAIAISLSIGLFGVSLIAVNNLRDIPTDAKTGKRTLAVKLGDHKSRIYYAGVLLAAYSCWTAVGISVGHWLGFIPLLTLPIAIHNVRACFSIQDRREFNALLAKSAALQVIFGIVASTALAISA
jgi:1,4-dihydroxy-2-naphthoate octaprenyltransferase